MSAWKINTDPTILFHILSSVLTGGLLGLAGVQALLLALQEHVIRRKRADRFITMLPPLEVMEAILFYVVGLGFLLLTVLLITSFYFYHSMILQHYFLIQKTILALGAWIILAILLLGRSLKGWRGQRAIHYTWCGVCLIIAVYFASK